MSTHLMVLLPYIVLIIAITKSYFVLVCTQTIIQIRAVKQSISGYEFIFSHYKIQWLFSDKILSLFLPKNRDLRKNSSITSTNFWYHKIEEK
jgi:hypothetical protein